MSTTIYITGKIIYSAATMKITTSHRLYLKALDQRRKQIRKMRLSGLTWTAIGNAMGITRQRAQKIGSK